IDKTGLKSPSRMAQPARSTLKLHRSEKSWRRTLGGQEMIGRIERILFLAAIVLAAQFSVLAAVSVDRLLSSQVSALPVGLTPVIIKFDHKQASADLTMLRSLGITGGIFLQQLPMVLTKINLAQLNAL